MAIQTINLGTAPSGAGGDTFRSTGTKVNENFTNKTHAASRLVGTAAGNVMEVGLDGFGSGVTSPSYSAGGIATATERRNGIYSNGNTSLIVAKGGASNAGMVLLAMSNNTGSPKDFFVNVVNTSGSNWGSRDCRIYNEANTTVDANGFLKNASPIIQLFADGIELNDEARQQEISFEKLGVGDYLIKDSSGFAQEGWYIETPKDANGNLLVAVVYEQLANGDISVKTYDYMLNKKGRIVADIETPLDIPENRWIDIRLQELPQPESEVTDDPE